MLKKGFVAVLVAGMIINISGLLFCQGFFHWVYGIGPRGIYRSSMMSQELSWLVLACICNFLFATVFVAGYALIYKILPSKGLRKGLIYGFLIWLIGFMFPILRTYLSVNLSAAIIIYWMINTLVVYLLMGAITGSLYKK